MCRRLRLPALVLFLAAWGIGPFRSILQHAWLHLQDETPVAQVAIEVPDAHRVICHHHPEGCPKDCFCPKITEEEGGAETPAFDGSLREPMLVRCTMDPSMEMPPLLMAAWIPAQEITSIPLDSGERLAPPHFPAPHDPFCELPPKVPRA